MTTFNCNGLLTNKSDYYDFLDTNGYVIFNSVLTEEQCDSAANILEHLSCTQVQTGRSFPHIDDELNLRIWSLLSKTDKFDYIIASDFIDSIMNHVFHRETKHELYFLSSFQGCILLPGAKSQKLHIDTPCPEPVPPYNLKANTIWCLDEFTELNGATEVLPGSHIYTNKPSNEISYGGLIKLVAPKGSVILTLGSLWHRGGANFSKFNRRALFASFAASWLREAAIEEDICRRLEYSRILEMNQALIKRIGMKQGQTKS